MSTNQWGETPTFYIWPADHEDGSPFPDDFYDDVNKALKAYGFSCQTA